MSQKIKTSVEIDGSLSASQIQNATTDTDKFLVSDGGVVKYRTGSELLSDLGVTTGTANHVQHQVKAGVAINKGQAVYVTGADGTNMIVGLASNDTEATSSKTMGLLNATVAINGFADVITEGLLSGLDTSTAVAGNPVWLGTGGNLIYGLANKPYAPNHLVFIGIVTRANANNGEIFVKVQNGFELDELHDVDLKTTTPINGHLLGFNGTLWVNKTIAGWLGYTPADDSAVVHKSGTETITGTKTFSSDVTANSFIKSGGTSDQYLKADGSVSSALNSRIEVNFIATSGQTTFSTSYEIGQVEVYYNGSKLYPDEFTATNGSTIVLATPATLNSQISIVKYVSTFTTTSIRNESIFTTTSGQTTFSVNYAVGQLDVFYNGSKLSTSEFTATNGTSVVLGFACASGESVAIVSYVNQVSGANGTANKIAKFTGAATLSDSQIFDNGTNIGIGTIIPSTDKLVIYSTSSGRQLGIDGGTSNYAQINFLEEGTTKWRLRKDNNNNFDIYTDGGGGSVLHAKNNGNVLIGTTTDAGYKLDVNGSGRFIGSARASAGIWAENNVPTALSIINTSVSGGNSSGTTAIYIGDAGSGVNAITREKVTVNTAYTAIYSEYGYNNAVKAVQFFNGSSQFFGNVTVSDNTTTGNGIQLSPADRPLITRGWDAFTSGNKSGVGRWGVYMEPSTLVLGTPNDANNGNVDFRRWNTDGTYSTTLRMTTSGNLLLRTTTDSGYQCTINSTAGNLMYFTLNSASVQMFMGSNSDFYISTANSQGVKLAVGATSWSAYSDIRLKNVTCKITNALDDISKLSAIKFTLKADATNKDRVGLIAQEVQEVLPEAVDEDDKGMLSVRYTEIIPLLVASIQEQQAQIKELQDELVLLKNK